MAVKHAHVLQRGKGKKLTRTTLCLFPGMTHIPFVKLPKAAGEPPAMRQKGDLKEEYISISFPAFPEHRCAPVDVDGPPSYHKLFFSLPTTRSSPWETFSDILSLLERA